MDSQDDSGATAPPPPPAIPPVPPAPDPAAPGPPPVESPIPTPLAPPDLGREGDVEMRDRTPEPDSQTVRAARRLNKPARGFIRSAKPTAAPASSPPPPPAHAPPAPEPEMERDTDEDAEWTNYLYVLSAQITDEEEDNVQQTFRAYLE